MSEAAKDLGARSGKRLENMTIEELYVEENADPRSVMDRLFNRQTDRQKAARQEIERRKQKK